MVTQLKALNVSVPILVMPHCDSARFAETLAEASEYAFCAGQWHASLNFKDEWFGSTADFAALYKQTFGEEAPDQAAQSAAAVLVFADAFARAQSLEAAKVREALARTERKIFSGRIKFDEHGRNIAKPMAEPAEQGQICRRFGQGVGGRRAVHSTAPTIAKKARARRPRTPSPHTACWPF